MITWFPNRVEGNQEAREKEARKGKSIIRGEGWKKGGKKIERRRETEKDLEEVEKEKAEWTKSEERERERNEEFKSPEKTTRKKKKNDTSTLGQVVTVVDGNSQ